MNKLLIIAGPTATGKTKLAFKLAEKYNGELISADSRQVYIGMDIGTGKNKPKSSRISIHGYDLVDPKEEFSVAHFQKLAGKTINKIHKKNKLPILVGGSGLYIKAISDGINLSSIPQNPKLRKSLNKKTTSELFEILARVDPTKSANLNNSDKNNPRRLIRAIEIAASNPNKAQRVKTPSYNTLMIGLQAPKKILNNKIKIRVKKRLDQGFEQEVSNLFKKGVFWQDQSMNTLGYKQWRDYLEKKVDREEAINNWIIAEQKYAKRQMTWFKKVNNINWFDITDKDFAKKVDSLVKKWYSV